MINSLFSPLSRTLEKNITFWVLDDKKGSGEKIYCQIFSITWPWWVSGLNLLIGCRHGLLMKISRKYGLQMARTSLWQCNSCPSTAIVQSTKSPRSYRLWKPVDKFSANFNLFQHSANSSIISLTRRLLNRHSDYFF